MVRDFSKVCLLIVGDGPLRKSLQQCVHDLELDHYVKFISTVPNYEVPSYCSICDIHVAPSIVTQSLVEAFGMVYLEAMASGKPSIAFDIPVPVQKIITDGETGYLVPEKDVEALASKICLLLSDDEKRMAMRKKAKEKALEQFDINKVVEKWADVLRTIISI